MIGNSQRSNLPEFVRSNQTHSFKSKLLFERICQSIAVELSVNLLN